MTDFETHVRQALESLPPDIAGKLENVAVVVEEENPEGPLEADFGDDDATLEDEIRITVLHELAHYFGIDEAHLDDLGYG